MKKTAKEESFERQWTVPQVKIQDENKGFHSTIYFGIVTKEVSAFIIEYNSNNL